MSQNLGSLPPLSRNVTLRRPPPPPLTRDVIYGFPLMMNNNLEYTKAPIRKYFKGASIVKMFLLLDILRINDSK